MEKEQMANVAGNLNEELVELGKLLTCNPEDVDMQVSFSVGCGNFFTIYCC